MQNLGFEYEFLDIKKLDKTTLQAWLKEKSFEALINTAGLSAKKLKLNKEKVLHLSQSVSGQKELEELILQSPTPSNALLLSIRGKFLWVKNTRI